MKARVAIIGLLTIGSGWSCFDDSLSTPIDDAEQPGGFNGEPSFGQPPPDGLLASPVRLALTPENALLVTDSRLSLIAQFDPASMSSVAAATVRGKPLAIGFLDGQVYVGNAAARTIDELDQHGNLVRSFGRGTVGYPSDLAVDARLGRLFVVDGLARLVKVFERNGTLVRTIGSDATFQAPVGIAVDTVRREVLVTDYGHPATSLRAAVKIFDYDGNFVAEISGRGQCGAISCIEGFSRPQGLAVDDAHIFVADAVLGAVLVFDRATLKLVKTLGGENVSPYLRVPSDVAIAPNGDIFVASNLAGRVEVFRGGAVVQ